LKFGDILGLTGGIYMLSNHKLRRNTWIVFVVVLLFAVGCVSAKEMPEQGKEKLAKHIESLTESSTVYEIVSAQKAPSYSSSEAMTGNVSFTGSNEVSGCPDDVGGREMWCVVLDREIASTGGDAYSHFLVQRLNTNWYVEELGSKERGEFVYLGCQNWDEKLADAGK
jgi:hypothetical protein